MKFIDITNKRFGTLVALRTTRLSTGRLAWICKCDCGNTKAIDGSSLKRGTTNSCGCEKDPTTHGLSHTIIGRTWAGILDRCLNPKSSWFRRYGGRGIRVCDYLRDSPRNLLSLMGPRPIGNFSLNRKNNDGNYSCGKCHDCISNGWPMNLEWATQTEQTRNTSRNREVEIHGIILCVAEWAEIFRIPYARIKYRIDAGWSGASILDERLHNKWENMKEITS